MSCCVAGGEIESEFAETVDHDCSEAGTDEPFELVEVCVCDEGLARHEDDWKGEEGDHQWDVVERENGEEESRNTRHEPHAADVLTPKAEVEFERGIDSSNSLGWVKVSECDTRFDAV